MFTRTGKRGWDVLLAAALMALLVGSAQANTSARFGPAVDAFCQSRDGSTPFAATGCALCHDMADLSRRIDPQWTWWAAGDATGDFAPFCTGGGPVNRPPVAANDNYGVDAGTVLNVSAPGVLGNDSDPEGAALQARLVAGPSKGSLTLNSNGSFSYTPQAMASGTDRFTYSANDGALDSSVATVTLTLNGGMNTPPASLPDAYTVAAGATLSFIAPGVLGNDRDAEGNRMTARLVTSVSNGTLTLQADGAFSYTPRAGFTGPDAFTYRANDGTADGADTVVTLTVTTGPVPGVCTDVDGDGFSSLGGICGPIDCNDASAAVNPGAFETCGDAIDNDCDGKLDGSDAECDGSDCVGAILNPPPSGSDVVRIAVAQWLAAGQLLVSGSSSRVEAVVSLSDARTGLVLGTTRVRADGTWQLTRTPSIPPCQVRAAVEGVIAEALVQGAPANCSSGGGGSSGGASSGGGSSGGGPIRPGDDDDDDGVADDDDGAKDDDADEDETDFERDSAPGAAPAPAASRAAASGSGGSVDPLWLLLGALAWAGRSRPRGPKGPW